MGWGNCGQDSTGRNIGYVFEAICDHPGCNTEIDRGLRYVCGNMHGADECSCEKYFCEVHKTSMILTDQDELITVCANCTAELLDSKEWLADEMDGLIKRIQE